MMVLSVTTLDLGALNFIGLVVPLLVGVLAKSHASSKLKALLNLGLSALAGGVAAAVQAKHGVDLGSFVQNIATTWGISVLSYYGLWKPTEVAPAVQNATANIGIGKPVAPDVTVPEVPASSPTPPHVSESLPAQETKPKSRLKRVQQPIKVEKKAKKRR